MEARSPVLDHGTQDCADRRGGHSLHKRFHLWVVGKSLVTASSQDDDQEWWRKGLRPPPRLRHYPRDKYPIKAAVITTDR
jgi:hypothetical protein